MSIEVQQLVKVYGSQKAVNDVSFTVKPGSITGFLGPNGAGKSTTMKIITGYLPATSGSVRVCGQDVSTHAVETRRKIGYLPESNALYTDLYVREYLGFLAGVHRLARPKQAVEQAIATVGLQNEAGKKVHQLSKGYKQRVGLAAALLHDPEVLILDEPTSGLDPNQILEIREVIRRQGKQKTILFSSHILQEVEALCDRVIIINKGTIVADDMLSNMLKKAHGGFVTLVLKENINSEIFEEIENCSKFNSTTWNFKTDDPEQLKKRLLQIALQKNLNIISLTSEATNLEEVFKRLTS